MRKPRVLVVDDSVAMVDTLKQYLADHGFEVDTATTGETALRRFAAADCDVVLTDLRMRGLDGLDVLQEIRKCDARIPVVIMTAFGNVQSAVDAIQRGAYHYLTKPFKMATVRTLLQRAADDRLVRDENARLRQAFQERFSALGLVGQSAPMRELRTLIGRVANAPSPVLIFGETGTGKETVARAIHVESERRDGSFVALNCAALPEMLLDSELFGNPGGAPSGVSKTQRGHLAEADGGTLFLDEVGDMSLPLQAKFLRVLQSGELRSGGHEATSRVDVRCVASTQRDLFSMVQDGKFREDLYFRLNVVPIRIPALRERQEDVALLVNHFLAHRGPVPRLGPAPVFTPEALRLLESHPWPGNVRELENLIERLVVTASRSPIDVEALRPELTPSFPGDPVQSLVRARVPLDELERRYIAAVLRHTEGNKTKAAAILKIDLSTLYRREKGQQH